MSNISMPQGFDALNDDSKNAIRKIMVEKGLHTHDGKRPSTKAADLPEPHQKALKAGFAAMGENFLDFPNIPLPNIPLPQLPNLGCVAARIAEAAAVAACATIPGGQIAIAVCVAAAHEAANSACN